MRAARSTAPVVLSSCIVPMEAIIVPA